VDSTCGFKLRKEWICNIKRWVPMEDPTICRPHNVFTLGYSYIIGRGWKVIRSASISMPCCMLYGSFIIMVVPQRKLALKIHYVLVNSMNAHIQSWIMKALKCLINLWLILVTNLISLKIISDSVWFTWSTQTQEMIWIGNRKKCFMNKSCTHQFLCSRLK